MTLQEFKERALEIFPGANVGGVTKDRHEPTAPLLVGLIQTDEAITFYQLARLGDLLKSHEIEVTSLLHNNEREAYIDITTTSRIRVTL
jgi:hypothetical protein